MNRFGFTLKVRPDRIDEYRRHHAAVWPEMLDALRRGGLAQLLAVPARRRHPLRIRRDARHARRRRSPRWHRSRSTTGGRRMMAPFFDGARPARRPDDAGARRGLPPRLSARRPFKCLFDRLGTSRRVRGTREVGGRSGRPKSRRCSSDRTPSGADPRVTNYGGGNTSCMATVTDPVTGDAERRPLREGLGRRPRHPHPEGLATLRLDRVRALRDVYRGVEHEDEMVAAFDHCRWGTGGAAPSIDTAMHALVDARHVDHLHPDAVIALAAAVDGEALTKECFGREMAWVPWRRPGFELGLQIASLAADNPGPAGRGARGPRADDLGRHVRRLPGASRST